jgi:ribonuclease BN (tRNA processing enzyme)
MFNIKSNKHTHPGGAHSYKIEADGKSVVYATDVEHVNGIDNQLVEFSRDVDLLIHEAHYTNEELVARKGWGHSSWEQAIEVAQLA